MKCMKTGLALCVLTVSFAGWPASAVSAAPQPLKQVKSIATGDRHSCALLTSGQARCWGINGVGQLGDGTTTDRSTAVAVLVSPGGAALGGIKQVVTGGGHTCALLSSGQARCWGSNFDGQLGDGTTTNRTTPVAVVTSPAGPALTGIKQLAAGGRHTCALLTSGQARCWGSNFANQLGDGTASDRLTPVPVLTSPDGPALAGIKVLAAGFAYTCALSTSAQARCWGQNTNGQLGDGTETNRSTPVAVLTSPGGPALAGIARLATGEFHTCASLTSSQARCWGDNAHGQLGDGTATQRLTPVAVRSSRGGPALTDVNQVSAGFAHSCFVLTSRQARCTGNNGSGQLGTGRPTGTTIPVLVRTSRDGPALTGIKSVATGLFHTCAQLSSTQARCWGENVHGQLGDGTTSTSRLPVAVLATAS